MTDRQSMQRHSGCRNLRNLACSCVKVPSPPPPPASTGGVQDEGPLLGEDPGRSAAQDSVAPQGAEPRRGSWHTPTEAVTHWRWRWFGRRRSALRFRLFRSGCVFFAERTQRGQAKGDSHPAGWCERPLVSGSLASGVHSLRASG